MTQQEAQEIHEALKTINASLEDLIDFIEQTKDKEISSWKMIITT